jgi:UDP-N-acetylmuramate dehydrogenase
MLPNTAGHCATGTSGGKKSTITLTFQQITTTPMVQILNNHPLKKLNTFGITAFAGKFVSIQSEHDLVELYQSDNLTRQPIFILGGGSNILFQGSFDGLIIHPELKGITVVNETEYIAQVEVAAGENWDDFVSKMVDKGLYGLENLSLIPGHVGASPVQNIGAYGVEVGNYIVSVKGFNLESGKTCTFTRDECRFDYRNSIFKQELKHKVIITSVVFQLSKVPVYHLNYGALQSEVERFGEVTLANVRKAIIAIRESKLPDPVLLGNAGSFFKNPIIDKQLLETIQNTHPQMPHYTVGANEIKIPAGWLIETAGWKGKAMGKAAVHQQQALVIVNLGGASSEDIIRLAEAIVSDVKQKFEITLEMEVNVV